MRSPPRTSVREAVARVAGEGLEFFTAHDLARVLGLPHPRAQQMALRIARAGLARRVRRGLYAIVPPAEWGGGPTAAIDAYSAAASAVRGELHYLAYYTAMELHDMTQHPLRTVFVAVARRHRDTTFGPVRIRFITLRERKLFGAEQRRLESGHVVDIAQLERTFIDGVDRPDLCGGIAEVLRGYVRRHQDIDGDRLVRLLYRFQKPVVTKRVGFLLEAAGHGDSELLWELERIAGRLRHYAPLDKTQPGKGTANRRWELLVNTDLKRLLASTRT